jgi:hypothetical protein
VTKGVATVTVRFPGWRGVEFAGRSFEVVVDE